MFETQIIQGRKISGIQLDQIRGLLRENPQWSRRRLSIELCQLWDWRGSFGQLKDMAARSLLNKLSDRRWIDLPPRRPQGGRSSFHVMALEKDLFAPTPITDALNLLRPLNFHLVKARQPEAKIFSNYLAHYHYLSYSGPVGHNLQYLVRDAQRRDLACLLFGAAAWKIAPRDRWIGFFRVYCGCFAHQKVILKVEKSWMRSPY